MSRLLRFCLERYCYFVSVRTYANQKIFQNEKIAELLVKIIFEMKLKLNFHLPAFVIMPDHIHLLIVPSKKNTISDVMRHIKGRFSRRFSQGMNSPDYECEGDDDREESEEINLRKDKDLFHFRRALSSSYGFRRAGNSSQPKCKVWQNRFYDHVIRDRKDFLARLKYIYRNPARAGLLDKTENYKFLFIDKNLEGYL